MDIQKLIIEECDAVKAMLLQKNADYGNSFAEPINVFSKLSPEEGIKIRLDDKLKRLRTGVLAINEDTEADIIGYLVLLRVLRRIEIVRDEEEARAAMDAFTRQFAVEEDRAAMAMTPVADDPPTFREASASAACPMGHRNCGGGH